MWFTECGLLPPKKLQVLPFHYPTNEGIQPTTKPMQFSLLSLKYPLSEFNFHNDA